MGASDYEKTMSVKKTEYSDSKDTLSNLTYTFNTGTKLLKAGNKLIQACPTYGAVAHTRSGAPPHPPSQARLPPLTSSPCCAQRKMRGPIADARHVASAAESWESVRVHKSAVTDSLWVWDGMGGGQRGGGGHTPPRCRTWRRPWPCVPQVPC